MKIYDFNGKKNVCGSRIKAARKAKKLTQTELAAQLQTQGIILDQISLSRIEVGTRFVADFELKTIANLLDCSIRWLLTGSDD
ncbi:MAG: helix-turn-helix transcriptional regulator [Butyrivibrio sp.]|nr:helix-turn-helix transcriptional regulator [Butyrivibrio sp.]